MNEIFGQHDLLLESSNRKEAELHARYFCEHNDLVRYDSIIIEPDAILCGNDPEFIAKLKSGLEGNKKAINGLVEELRTEGALEPEIWSTLQQGYSTKLLHTAVHLLDGFFGVDSVLYSLIDNSHQVTGTLRNKIKENPEKYWLVHVSGASASGHADRVQMLRPFGREKRGEENSLPLGL